MASGMGTSNQDIAGGSRIKEEPRSSRPLLDTIDGLTAQFTTHASAAEIRYTPERFIGEGLAMVKHLKAHIDQLEIGNGVSKETWLEEIKSLERQRGPRTMIAVYGATGSGKSSVINALLDDTIVPTSGMRACTAVVTEIGYHSRKSVAAEVTFLSVEQWKAELAILLDDLRDEDGRVKHSVDLSSESGTAWHKVHSVYPELTLDSLAGMTVDEVLQLGSEIVHRLGTVKRIEAKNSKDFSKRISKFIESRDDSAQGDKDKGVESGDDRPALWPLIRQVKVWCSSPVLSTGAILVDVPGVADANVARSNIAKEYMKNSDCIWIVAPIIRAVDDKVAKDLLGHAFKTQLMSKFTDVGSAITFVATKCDDISSSEIIRALQLKDDPVLQKIEADLGELQSETRKWKSKMTAAEKTLKRVGGELKRMRAAINKHQEHVQALIDGNLQTWSAKFGQSRVKRKKPDDEVDDTLKRRKTTPDPCDSQMSLFDTDLNHSAFDPGDSPIATPSPSDAESSSDSEPDDLDLLNDDDDSRSELLLTIDEVMARLQEKSAELKDAGERQNEAIRLKKDAADMISALDKRRSEAQREKSAICSLKRSNASRSTLKRDFRAGLKEFDDKTAERLDPSNFDPAANLRDYASIDLPVFTLSSRDYIRLTKQVKGDGDPVCFSKVEDTGVPALREWCHTLTIQARENSARSFRSHMRVFAASIKSCLDNVGTISEMDRKALRERWETARVPRYKMLRISSPSSDDSDDGYGTSVSVRLEMELQGVVDENAQRMKTVFRSKLGKKCQDSAEEAANSAIKTYDAFADSMHWRTFRATLRRDGAWNRDLNEELVAPMTTPIASSWARIFKTNFFSSFTTKATETIEKLFDDFEASCPAALRDKARSQCQASFQEAMDALKKIVSAGRHELSRGQKAASRRLVPQVREQMTKGYKDALAVTGRGSVAIQKAIIRDFIEANEDSLFRSGADLILNSLDTIAVSVGGGMKSKLQGLGHRVEANLSTLWVDLGARKGLAGECAQAIESIDKIVVQLDLWEQADEIRSSATQTQE
ncbi:hypothetical protein BOTBODRAFT_29776 [Botryobasidium botryosum FD-172 SS1]|uniref:G domain-containing protein n=1 Tax=Botryobasidium botryosum (strain FD-172 SS1) TaxID=930990 RepID=A0A067MSB4_BOTB1|nr:hypothetical protein BOTBODRAFT_29776 [Botryobasidium botryosum FD-172 SS1]